MEFGQRDGRVVPRQIDALLPKEMARRAERIGTEKAEQASLNLLVLGTLAGAFVAFGATFAAAVTAGADTASSPGLVKLAGGVTFETPDMKAPVNRKIQRFTLHTDREEALKEGVAIQIKVPTGDGINPDTPIRYKGIEVGKVEAVELTDDLQAVLLHARITQAAGRIASAGSSFWVVKPELGLVRTANLETLVSGQYLEVSPAAKAGKPQHYFEVLEQPPTVAARENGLRLVLSAARRGSIKPGVVVSYREIPVGKVTDFELGPTSDRVLIHVLIEPRYAPLVRSGSRFWNASGIGVDAGL